MTVESFTFDKGINRRKNRIFLEDGELYSCKGFSYERDGMLETRSPKVKGEVIDTTATSRINGIHRQGDNVYASSKALCPGGQVFFNYIYQRGLLESYSNINIMSGHIRPRFADFEKFTFVLDGESKRAYVDDKAYEWGIANPEIAPILTQGVPVGYPTGSYDCYVTFYIKFPNDKYVETGPSPAGSVTITDSHVIEWSRIPTSGYQGEGLDIHRRLYRTVSGIAYLVTTLTDNTTTTYTDGETYTDGTLQLASILGTAGYRPPPNYATDVVAYLQRMFLIKGNKLYWSESYSPFSFIVTSDVTVTKDNEDLIAITDWSDQLWLASSERWLRLQGSDPETWAIKRTFADVGIINPNTLKKSIYGIFGLWNDGIYLFDGSVSKNITDKKLGKKFFTNLDDLTVCYAEWDSSKYYFYYPSSGSVVDSCIVIDFTYHPDYRIYEDDFIADAHESYKDTKHQYLVKGGYEYNDGEIETIATSFTTGEKGFGNIIKRKCLDYFYYDIDTQGKDVVIDILVDGISVQTVTLNTSGRVRKRSDKLKAIEGYRFALQYSCVDSQSTVVYSPWILETTPVGE